MGEGWRFMLCLQRGCMFILHEPLPTTPSFSFKSLGKRVLVLMCPEHSCKRAINDERLTHGVGRKTRTCLSEWVGGGGGGAVWAVNAVYPLKFQISEMEFIYLCKKKDLYDIFTFKNGIALSPVFC